MAGVANYVVSLISEELVVNHIPDSTGLSDSLFDHFAVGWYWGYFQFFAILTHTNLRLIT